MTVHGQTVSPRSERLCMSLGPSAPEAKDGLYVVASGPTLSRIDSSVSLTALSEGVMDEVRKPVEIPGSCARMLPTKVSLKVMTLTWSAMSYCAISLASAGTMAALASFFISTTS